MSFASIVDEFRAHSYQDTLTIESIITVLFALALTLLMLVVMINRREFTARNLAAISYPLSTVILFLVIALRQIYEWPQLSTLLVVGFKMVAVAAVTIWAFIEVYRGVRKA